MTIFMGSLTCPEINRAGADSLSLIILTNLFPNPIEPGRSTFNEQLIRALNDCAPVAAVIVPIDWVRTAKYWYAGKRSAITSCKDWKGLPVHYPTYAYVPRYGRWLNGFLMFLSLLPVWTRLRGLSSKAIFAIWAFPEGFAAVLLGALSRQRVVVRVIGSDVEILSAEHIRRVLTVWALNRCHRVVSVCEYLKQRLVQHGVRGELIDVVYEGVDREKFFARDKNDCRLELKLEQNSKTILFVGNLKFDKGPVDLLEAAIPLLKKGGVELYFVGDGPAAGKLSMLAQHHQVDSAVHLVGRVQHQAVPVWMNAADLLCLPSHHEGVPNVIVEATACGVPIVATAVGGIPEVLSSANGYIVPLRDLNALSRALEDCLNKEWDRTGIQLALRAGTWEQAALKISECLGSKNER